MSKEDETSFQGIGTDIIEIHRIQEAIERHGERFIDRLFTPNEKEYCFRYKNIIPHFAGRFAGKEAVFKALGTGMTYDISWKEIEIINDSHGKPQVVLTDRVQHLFPGAEVFVSISHCDAYATATAIVVNRT